MDQLARLKDTVLDYFSPKRRRTIGPVPGTPSSQDVHIFVRPFSDPQIIKSRDALGSNERTWSPSEKHPRKRRRDESEIVFRRERETIEPDDSISQVVTSFEQETILLTHGKRSMGALALNGVEENVEAGSEDSRDTEHSDSMELESNSLSEEDVDPEYEVFVDRNAVTSASGRYKRESLGEEVEESEQLMDSVEDDDESSSGVVAAYNPSSEEDESEDDPELVAEAKAQELLTRQTLLARRQDAISRFKVEGGWHPDAMNVFERLEMRSYEAIFPWSWKMDFPTLPDLLFSTEGNTFITNNEKNAASGAKALQPLLSLSLTVHEKIEANVPEDRINMFIAREIKHYVTWSERDGGFFGKRFIPALYVHRAKAIDKFDFISKVASEQMMLLAQRHREALGIFEDANGNVHIDPNGRAPPLIYGIIIAQEKVFFMTHDSADPRATVKLLHHFDLSDKDEGVWNGIAIALLVVAARQYNMAIKDELETDDDPLTDVDA